jgi:hypothetical protein
VTVPSDGRPLQVPSRSAIATLSALLEESNAKPNVRIERLAPSAIYDLDYRVFVVAAAFERHAKPAPPIARRIHATKLKLLQFIAIRPRLLPIIREWSKAKRDEELSFTTQDLRRGFLGDQMFDSVVAFLVARGALESMGTHLVEGKNAILLSAIYTAAIDTGLFKVERQTIEELTEIKITVRMLEGE